jgi:AcrR family transcriptional regulator
LPQAAAKETGTTPKVRRKSQKESRPRDPVRTSAAILAAAREEFCARGFDGARVDSIAAKAKANKRLLYHYFGNKAALYRAVLHDAYVEIRHRELKLNLQNLGPLEAMERLVRFTFQHFLANPWFTRLLANENMQNARFLKQLPDIPALQSPLLVQLSTLVLFHCGPWLFLRRQHAHPFGCLRP